MQLMTEEVRELLPLLNATESIPDEEKLVPVKFFSPVGAGTWWCIEFDGDDLFFGYVDLGSPELGYFRLSELENVELPFGLSIERDLHWDPDTTLQQVMDDVAATA